MNAADVLAAGAAAAIWAAPCRVAAWLARGGWRLTRHHGQRTAALPVRPAAWRVRVAWIAVAATPFTGAAAIAAAWERSLAITVISLAMTGAATTVLAVTA